MKKLSIYNKHLDNAKINSSLRLLYKFIKERTECTSKATHNAVGLRSF